MYVSELLRLFSFITLKINTHTHTHTHIHTHTHTHTNLNLISQQKSLLFIYLLFVPAEYWSDNIFKYLLLFKRKVVCSGLK